MPTSEPRVRNVSDTALWVAIYRAWETEHPSGLFRDPFARRLAGELGEKLAGSLSGGKRASWAFVARTLAFDQLIQEGLGSGVDTVVNLAAGLCARPYRMALPAGLRWVEVDFPAMIDYKEEILAHERPRCQLERIRLDLADVAARRSELARVLAPAKRALIVSEGLLVYLEDEQVATLAQDLAAEPAVTLWAMDLITPALLRRLQRSFGRSLAEAGTPLRFAPAEGLAFFARQGWPARRVLSLLRVASDVRRLPWWLSWLGRLRPHAPPRSGRIPWGGVCLLERRR